MSWKASKAQIVDPVVINKFIIGCVTFQTSFIAIMIFIQNVFAITSEPMICSNLEHTILIEVPYPSIVALIEATVIILFGLSCDILLYSFMKKRNIQLIPWKDSQDDPSIPMKATLVTTVSMIMSYVCVLMCLTAWYSGKFNEISTGVGT